VIEESGRKAISVPGDLTDEAYCREIVERTVSDLGGIDIAGETIAVTGGTPLS
jgi:NAD(P)-dependent dehydrogenase (short-subunit alcohol dehydrogenase family)